METTPASLRHADPQQVERVARRRVGLPPSCQELATMHRSTRGSGIAAMPVYGMLKNLWASLCSSVYSPTGECQA